VSRTRASSPAWRSRRCRRPEPSRSGSPPRTRSPPSADSPLLRCGDWGTKDHGEGVRVIHRALDAGINFIDTADVYSHGESEILVGKALAGGKRDDVVLASKVRMPMAMTPTSAATRAAGSSRRSRTRCSGSGPTGSDVYQVHRPDPDTDIDETLGALSDLVHQGKIRYIGHSTFPASEIVEAQWTAQDRGRERFRCEQPPYSILTRAIEHDVLPTCARYGMGVISYSPFAGGWLSGRYREGAEVQGPTSPARQRLANRFDMSLPANQRKLEAAEALAQLADETGISLIELAIAFVIGHPAVTAAIIGPRTIEHLESQLTAADVELSADVLDRIDEINPPGVTINNADNGWTTPALRPDARRR
jgi:aryl-alcohol dehydrogenase-like predicted oxidoreductase